MVSLPSNGPENVRELREEKRPEMQEVDPGEVDLDALPKCPTCGYSLYKLARFRCPECGTLISAEDISPTLARQYVDELWRTEVRWGRIGMVMLGMGVVQLLVASYWLWPLTWCFALPLAGTTLVTVMFRRFMGEPVRPVLPLVGALWVMVGFYSLLLLF